MTRWKPMKPAAPVIRNFIKSESGENPAHRNAMAGYVESGARAGGGRHKGGCRCGGQRLARRVAEAGGVERLNPYAEVIGDCGYRFVVKTFPLGVDLLKAFFAVGVVFKEIDALRVARGYFPDFCAFATGHEGEPYIVGCGR